MNRAAEECEVLGYSHTAGTIQGRIIDPQGALLPSVTVTTTSPSALGAQTTVSSETGNYRFPALPPGTYEVTYALAGFKTLKRTGSPWIISLFGFAATHQLGCCVTLRPFVRP